MMSMKLSGRINENGQLELELPQGLPMGNVTVQIELVDTVMPVKQFKTGAEIVALLETMDAIEFVDNELTDPVEWVLVQRAKDENRLKQYWEE
jgi:hypothetical protein